jgi:hypothetical protein
MKIKSYLIAIVTSAGLFSFSANAAFMDVTLLPEVASGTLHLVGAKVGGKANPLTVTFAGTSLVQKVLFSNDANGDLHDQSPTTIGSAIEKEFAASGLTLVDDRDLKGSSASISTADPFKFLAIHFGQHELFFQFLTSTNNFSITTSGKAAGLSNFRAYNTPSTVPIPAAVWLFGTGLAGLLGVNRKKAKASI